MNKQKHFYNIKKSKENIFSNNEIIIDYVYTQNFPEILKQEKSKFLNNIENQIIELLKCQYKNNDFLYQKELEAYEKNKNLIKNRYESDFLLLNSKYKNYKRFPNKALYLTKFRKHCANSEKIPVHKCPNNKFGKLIEIFKENNYNENKISSMNKTINTKNSSYIICTECSTCFMNSLIKIYCSFCKCEYFSSKLDDNINENILPATWKVYHCKSILVNEMMKCIKCGKILYINLVTKKLVCLNKRCNFSSNPHSILWKCKICKKDFRSSAKVFNPLEIKILQNEVWKCLLYKNIALPKKLFCCGENKKNKNIKYYHDKKCHGELYKWIINEKEIIVCGLCHAINFYEKFIWTCPFCKLKYNSHGKKDRNENENNKNLILKNNSKIKKISLEKNNTENKLINGNNIENEKMASLSIKRPTHRHNYSSNIEIFTTDKDYDKDNEDNNNIKEKKIIYENSLSLESIEGNNNTTNFNKNNSFLKNKDEKVINIIYTNSNNDYIIKPKYSKKKKKIRYQTLFDILEEREKSKINNQSIDENINKDYLSNVKNKINEYYSKKRIKLLEQSKANISNKKIQKTLFQRYYVSNEKKNILINNLINNKYLTKNKKLNNNMINISDTEEKQDINNENNLNEYDSINKNLKKKLTGDLHIFPSSLIAITPESKNSEIINNKNKFYSKRYKNDQSTTINDEIKKIKKISRSNSKNLINKNDKRSKIYINNKKYDLQETNNIYKSFKKNSENNLYRNMNNNHHNEKDNIKIIKLNQTNNDTNENKVNKKNNKYGINEDINSKKENEINYWEEEKLNIDVKLEKEKHNSTKLKKNNIFKSIFLNKMSQNSKNIITKENNLLDNDDNIIDNINNDFNNFDMRISPFGDIGQDIVTKDEFLKISNECKIPTFEENNINYLNPIGRGSYGVIYLVEDKNTKKQFALKRVLCQDIEQILKHKKEFELSYLLNHSNLIKIHNVLFKYLDLTTYALYVLMEKAETDWNTEIEKRKISQNFYTESELIDIMKQLVSVLYYFQTNNIAHRDIKPSNILICKNNIYKITDLGEAKNSDNTSKLATLKGSQLFMSPNLFLVLKYEGIGTKAKHNVFKSDVFSLGYCFLYAMSLDLKLIKFLREETSMFDVLSVMRKFEIENKFSEKFMNIIYKMIQTDEDKRCDFIELKEEMNKNLNL